jgi:hypothetical protein
VGREAAERGTRRDSAIGAWVGTTAAGLSCMPAYGLFVPRAEQAVPARPGGATVLGAACIVLRTVPRARSQIPQAVAGIDARKLAPVRTVGSCLTHNAQVSS